MIPALLIASLMAASPATATKPPMAGAPTVDDLQTDFLNASPCADIDGRKVWKGGIAYYIQSYVYGEGATDASASDEADAVLPADNSPETMKDFESACNASAP